MKTLMININMRCIEMLVNQFFVLPLLPININMRCIEMKYSILYDLIFQRLTLT